MQIGWNENRAVLCGRVDAPAVFSHENHGTRYQVFPLAVPRLSGAEDRLNVVASERQFLERPLSVGDWVCAEGQVRSYNNRSGRGSRLVITLLAHTLAPGDEPRNDLLLSGALCKPPIFRRTPLGREICDMMLAVNRRYGRADYLPCIAWGSLAQRGSTLDVGAKVRLEGRLQSRSYQKVVEGVTQERTAFEISVMGLSELTEEETIPSPGE